MKGKLKIRRIRSRDLIRLLNVHCREISWNEREQWPINAFARSGSRYFPAWSFIKQQIFEASFEKI